jgi:hypothetical protein
MTNKEFERLDREERLATLKFTADVHGIDSDLYCRLAKPHRRLLIEASGIPLRV